MATRRGALLGAAATAASVPRDAAAQPPAAPRGRWEARAPLPWAVQEVYGCALGGRLLVAGGLAPNEAGRYAALDRAALYDPAADAWREAAPLPAPRHHPALVALADGRTALALGGFASDGRDRQWIATPDVSAFDGARWATLAPMPRPLCETVAAVLSDGLLHLATGRVQRAGGANGRRADHDDAPDHLVLDPATGRWSEARPAPAPRNSAAGAGIGGALYVVGGRTAAEGNTARLDRYDPATDRWDTLRPLPVASGGLAAAAFGGRLVAYGGERFDTPGGAVIGGCWSYDPATDRWETLAPMRTPRHGLAGVALAGRVFAVAGGVVPSGGRPSGVVEALSLDA